jgi:hypothetical protein
MATYTYRSGAAPTAVDTMTEATREEAQATASRIQGSGFSQVRELRPTLGWTIDTNADEYTGVIFLDGTAIKGARQAFPVAGFGGLGTGATITAFPIVMQNEVQAIEVDSTGSGDFGFWSVQHGDTVATGFSGFGITYI